MLRKMEMNRISNIEGKSKFIDILFVLNLNWKHFAAFSDH